MNNIFEKFKVLIIDDEEDITDILDTVLKREGFSNIYIANNGTDGIELFKKVNPDIVLLDIMLPDISGYDVFNELRKDSQIPILFISAKTEEVDRLLGFAIGADDYITKPFSAKEVAFRLKARLKTFDNVVTNKNIKENKIIKFGDIEINEETGEVYKSGKLLELTAKELKLLIYLVNHPNRILSKETICNEVWGEDFFGYDNTITVHIRRLRKKIEDNPSKPKYLITVIGLGYKLVMKGE
ncbi:response regulator transcription factor [Clostridium sp. NSJ-49]|jgi:DNA-binding response OmpR family regulator|uniref:Stage 0 sporulation protein A homolog n=1 Tax=Clostridium disporicum TaxID=84024 RepID=A0A174HD58_9CLOT|nr:MULTISPECIES: response regulator transcription factor [Clostridium]MBC5625260.1 response regulator transcription factor [Clostridium sp. NSJ-49]MCD2502113.1 response regulator transcription factor [Clostridium sp. NSJ-145]CUO71276.1 signal transduction response regulator [Clostridium disporicum]